MNEIALMMACARVCVDQETEKRIRLLAGGRIDWDQFVNMSIRHKVLPLVFQNLSLICKDSFPENLKNRLETTYIFENSVHNLSLVEQLFVILDLLKKKQITAVPFKGPVLAENVFGDITLRRYLDLDILISKKDAVKAVDVLMEKGFMPEKGALPEGKGKKPYLEKLVAVSLVHPKTHLSIDLQWDISNRFSNVPILLEDMEPRIEQVVLHKKHVPSLPPEELLCYLCIHGTKHRWLILDLVCCISELIRARKDIDWHYTQNFAKKIHCTTVLFLGLCLSRDLLRAKLPDHINKRIDQSKAVKGLAEKVYDGLFSNYMETMITPEKFDPFLFRVKDRFQDKILYCMKVLFIPSKEDLRVFPLPETLSFIRYLLRPARLITEYGKRSVRRRVKYIQK
jgi:hypothetical protein